MPRPSSHPFDALVERFARMFADRIVASLPAAAPRSLLGPRFRFLCEEHAKLPVAQQNAALQKWAAKNAK
jgi:hypothetical protein